MDTDSKYNHFIEKLKQFVVSAEKDIPIDDLSFEAFDDDELGSLLNRLVEVFNRYAREQSFITERNKKQLTQNINHELKTPVTSIQGYLETIINNPEMSTAQENIFINKCYEQSLRLSHLLQDLSVITRMDEASELIEKEELSLSAIINEEVRENLHEAAAKGIDIINNVPDNLLMRGNKSLLQSVFHNLINNAISYSQGSRITISLLEKSGKTYALSFADDGVGIADEHLTRIFERFYRIDKGRSRRLGGTGLGLSIVKNAVILHGGSIQARPNKGGGLEFVFTLELY